MAYENDVFLRSTSTPSGNDVWLYDPTTYAMGSFAALTLVAGQLVQNAAAGGADLKVYLNAGRLYARTLPMGGDKLVQRSDIVS